jgi:macrolide transport system ATP-binding/permease protein
VPGVEKVAAYVSGRGQATWGGKNWNTRIEGTTADYPALRSAAPARGRFFTAEETITRARLAVIGQTVATQLFGEDEPIGRFIRVRRVDFQVIGVFPIKGSNGFRDEDDRITVPLNTAMYRLLGREYVDYMDVKVSDAAMMDDVAARITSLLVSLHRLPPSRQDTIEVRNMADIQETITSTTKAFSYLLGGIAFISLLVGGIGIMNIMLVSVSERTREIGLRKAIGATNRDILMQFVIEAVAICVLGGICGIVFGSAVSLGLGKFAGWSTRIAPASVALAFVFSVLIGLIFGVWPARSASRLNPIEALRSE